MMADSTDSGLTSNSDDSSLFTQALTNFISLMDSMMPHSPPHPPVSSTAETCKDFPEEVSLITIIYSWGFSLVAYKYHIEP